MCVLVILILASLTLATAFLGCFVWAVRSGQFEDTVTPSMRVLSEDEKSLPVAAVNESRTRVLNPKPKSYPVLP